MVDPSAVATALGAESIGVIAARGSALSAFTALRAEIANRLTSTGGRPALEGVVRRQKISLYAGDWERLIELSDRMGEDGFHPTPGQVASALLHSSLANIDFAAKADADVVFDQREFDCRVFRYYRSLIPE